MFCPFLDCKTVSTPDSCPLWVGCWRVVGGSTFSLQLCISISKSCICLLFLPVICPWPMWFANAIWATDFMPVSHRCLHCRFLSSCPDENLGLFLFACLHATSHLSSTWPKKKRKKKASYFYISHSFVLSSSLQMMPLLPLAYHVQFGLLPMSALPVYLDLAMCFWIQFTSYDLLYLSLNRICSGFHHLSCCKSLSSDNDKCNSPYLKCHWKHPFCWILTLGTSPIFFYPFFGPFSLYQQNKSIFFYVWSWSRCRKSHPRGSLPEMQARIKLGRKVSHLRSLNRNILVLANPHLLINPTSCAIKTICWPFSCDRWDWYCSSFSGFTNPNTNRSAKGCRW